MREDWMQKWWTQMLTLTVAILSASAVFIGRGGQFEELWRLWASWVFLIISLVAGSLKLWGWSAEEKAKEGQLLYLRNLARKHLGGSRVVAVLAYLCFTLGLIFLLFFAKANVRNGTPDQSKSPVRQVAPSPNAGAESKTPPKLVEPDRK